MENKLCKDDMEVDWKRTDEIILNFIVGDKDECEVEWRANLTNSFSLHTVQSRRRVFS